MKSYKSLYKKFIASVILGSTTLGTYAALAEKIREIKVNGNQRIEKDTILNYSGVTAGIEYEDSIKAQIIKELYKTNFFNDVSVKFQKGTLVINVDEAKFVSKVKLSGNSKIKSSEINKEIHTHPSVSLSNWQLKEDIETIKRLYRIRGRYAIQVHAEVRELKKGSTEVEFKIKEGPKTSIKYINFAGNNSYSDSDLKYAILSKESAWHRFLEVTDTYDPDRIEYDKFLLKSFYNSSGFADFRILSTTAELSKNKDYFTLTFALDEGDIYNFGQAKATSNISEIDSESLRFLLNIKEGERYNSELIKKISESIKNHLQNQGFSEITVDPIEDKDLSEKVVNVNFVIRPASRTNIDKINITGNLKTKDHIIRRQFHINEGDIFNRDKIAEGERNIRSLDYFESVKIEVSPSQNRKNMANINTHVEEKSTSSINFELGYDTLSGPVGRINFTERNLFGEGKILNLKFEKFKKKTNYSIGITEPYFMDRDLLVGGSFFHDVSRPSSDHPYGSYNFGGNLRLSYNIANDISHDIGYTYKREKLSGTYKDDSSIFIKEQLGTRNLSSLSNTFTYNRTDNIANPKNGYVTSYTQTTAGIGGNVKYLSNDADFKIFKSFYNNKFTLKFAADAGIINGYGGQKVSIADSFSLGDFKLRGFRYSGVGPRTSNTKEALGGKKYYTFTSELHFPFPAVPKEFNLTGAAFVDVGALWGYDHRNSATINNEKVYDSKTPNLSVGFGILWNTRLAPIRIDYGVALKKKPYDETQRIHIRLATSL